MPREIMDLGRVGSSIGRSLADLFSGNARQQGYDAEMGRLADMDAKRAQAGFQQARADNERQRMRFQTPEFGNKLAATLAGLNDPQAAQMEQFQKSGNWGTRNFIPSAFDEQDLGDMLGSNKIEEDAPAWATPDVVGKYRQGLAAHAMNLAGTGDTNASQMADAFATLRKQGGIDLALSNPSTAPVFGQAMAASQGKALYDNAGGDTVFNQFTGGDIVSTREDAEAIAPLMSQLFGQQYQVQGDDAQGWRLMPVAGEMYLDDQGNPVPRKASLNMDFARALGIDENRMRVLVNMAAADPKLAQKFAEQSMRQLLRPAPVERLPADYNVFQREQAAGKIPPNVTYSDWHERMSRARASTVNVGAPSVTVKEAMKTQGKEFGKFAQKSVEDAQNAMDVAGDISLVVEGLRGMGGGPVAEFKAWAGKLFPADSDWGKMASMHDLAKTVQTKLAPTMRAPGSGATSDMEMKAYMAAIPTLSTTERGRELMLKYAMRVAERAQIRAEVVNDIEQSGRLPTPRGIQEGMRKRLPDSFFDAEDRAYFNLRGTPAQSAAPAARPPVPTTQKLTPAEQKELDELRKRFGK